MGKTKKVPPMCSPLNSNIRFSAAFFDVCIFFSNSAVLFASCRDRFLANAIGFFFDWTFLPGRTHILQGEFTKWNIWPENPLCSIGMQHSKSTQQMVRFPDNDKKNFPRRDVVCGGSIDCQLDFSCNILRFCS